MMLRVTDSDIDIAARTAWGEARGEGREGLIAVLWVIRNRVTADLRKDGKPDWWGEGVAGVCLKAGQFSCWNSNDPNLPKLRALTIADPTYRLCVDWAEGVLSGRIPDPTAGSTHYHTSTISPRWARGHKPAKRIGAHLFFNTIS